MSRGRARPSRGAARRRRIAVGVLAGLSAAAFALGAAMGNDGSSRAAEPTVAEKLSLPRLAGERLVAGVTGTTISPQLRAAIEAGRLAGVVLFSENFPNRRAGASLVFKLQRIPRPPGLRSPLLIMIDQEGGQVTRLPGAPEASAAEMGEKGAAFSRGQGRATALNLSQVGVNVDLAPVLDVGRPGGVIAETERAFGSTAAQVTATAVPFAEGLQAGNVVAATAKHFPGLGAAQENTDFATQRIELSKARLRAVDEAPYGPFIAAGGKLVMLSTAIYPAFSEDPAAFSRAIATGELRERLGFRGVSISDALETAAVEDFGGPARAAVAGATAGTDLLLFTDLAGAEAGGRALVAQLRARHLSRARFEASVTRVLRLRAGLPRR